MSTTTVPGPWPLRVWIVSWWDATGEPYQEVWTTSELAVKRRKALRAQGAWARGNIHPRVVLGPIERSGVVSGD